MNAKKILTLSAGALALLAANGHALADTNCNTSGHCLGVNQTGDGYAIVATKVNNFASAIYADGGNSTGVVAEGAVGIEGDATTYAGVAGYSTGAQGVYGYSSVSDGVDGQSNTSGKSGVYAHNSAANGGYGVYGRTNGSGQAVHGENKSSAGWAGYFNGDVGATRYVNLSDARLKKQIRNSPYGLDQLLKLRPVAFEWKDGEGRGTQIGLIAQEVQKVVPEAVRGNAEGGMLAIDYNALLPVVIRAVQKQQEVIKQQEARIAELEQEKRPLMSSVTGGLGGGLAFGLLPLGLFFTQRFRRRASW